MPIMPFLGILLVAGLLMYLVNNYFALKGWIKTVLNTLVILILVIWLLKNFGIIGEL